MFILSRLITFVLALVLIGSSQRAFAQEASAWVEGHRSRVRLLAGGSDGVSALAGVEIRLDPGFKTYWRSPGEAGLPPAFDWSKSTNVGGIEVLWPAPTRSEDAGGVSYGYQGQVVFPVRIRSQVPLKPTGLGLKIDYGVCKDICIPAQAELALKLPASPSPLVKSEIESALARVPQPKPLNAEGDLAVLAVEPSTFDGKPRLAVTVRAPAESKPALFAEGPDNWFLLPTEKPTVVSDKAAGQTFLVEVMERPRDAAGPVDLRFTLVAGDKAVETTTSLDAARLER